MRKTVRIFPFVFLGFILLVAASLAPAQSRFFIPLTVTDEVDLYTIGFGIVPNSHFCVVESDSIHGMAEFFLPPTPPQGVFDARFTCPRNSSGFCSTCFDQGTTYDFRPYTSATQKDTFRIKCQLGSGSVMVFRWPSNLATLFQSLTLRYFDGTSNVNVNMLQPPDTVDVSLAGDPATVTIYSSNPLPVSVQQTSPDIPREFSLSQNYPNPFNPTTTMTFSVPQTAKVDISVYDVLGRKVSTLAADLLAPGYYTAKWDGRNASGTAVASGVYFVRMTSQAEHGANFSAMRKLLLMK